MNRKIKTAAPNANECVDLTQHLLLGKTIQTLPNAAENRGLAGTTAINIISGGA